MNPDPHAPHVVLGYGQAGRPLVELLIEAGQQVRVLTRRRPADLPAAAEHRAVDLTDARATAEACAGAAVIHHVAGAPYAQWPTVLPAILESALVAARTAGAPLVYLDNLYAYGAPGVPISARSQPAPVEEKGRLRLRLADRLVADARAGRLPGAAIVHASDFFGPGVTNSVPAALLLRPLTGARGGGRPCWPIDAGQAHAVSYIPDVARTMAAAARRVLRDGDVCRWMTPVDGALTGAELARAALAELGRPAAGVRVLSRPVLRAVGLFSKDARELARLSFQFDRPYLVDAEPTVAELGVRPTPLPVALAATLSHAVPGVQTRSRTASSSSSSSAG